MCSTTLKKDDEKKKKKLTVRILIQTNQKKKGGLGERISSLLMGGVFLRFRGHAKHEERKWLEGLKLCWGALGQGPCSPL